MLLRIPKYYTQFQCIADQCKDSCCIGWEINIDEDTYDYYQQIPGDFGKRLRRNTSDHKERKFLMQHKRCPFLNKKNLCDICIELGEEALCETCTEYPRSIMEYGNVREKCLSLSCEEAGRLIFESPEKCEFMEMELPEEYGEYVDEEIDESEECLYDGVQQECAVTLEDSKINNETTKFYENLRDQAIQIVQDREFLLSERIADLLRFGQQAQEQVTVHEGQMEGRTKETIAENLKSQFTNQEKVQADGHNDLKYIIQQRFQIFRQMEALDEEWEKEFKSMFELFGGEDFNLQQYLTYQKDFSIYYKEREYEYEHLLVYFLFRYGMMAIYDHDFLGKVKLSIISFLMIRDLDVNCFIRQNHQFTKENRIDIARIYSKQVEHAQEILDYLEQAIKEEAGFDVASFIYGLSYETEIIERK